MRSGSAFRCLLYSCAAFLLSRKCHTLVSSITISKIPPQTFETIATGVPGSEQYPETFANAKLSLRKWRPHMAALPRTALLIRTQCALSIQRYGYFQPEEKYDRRGVVVDSSEHGVQGTTVPIFVYPPRYRACGAFIESIVGSGGNLSRQNAGEQQDCRV